MSDILIIWLSALVSQMAPYLIFILLQKSTRSVNMVLYSQNARLCGNCALIRPTILGKGPPLPIWVGSHKISANRLEFVQCHRNISVSLAQLVHSLQRLHTMIQPLTEISDFSWV